MDTGIVERNGKRYIKTTREKDIPCYGCAAEENPALCANLPRCYAGDIPFIWKETTNGKK